MGLFFQLLSLTLAFQDSSAGCFEDHLNEARALNKKRAQIYAKITNGESEKVSAFLISAEYLAHFSASTMDKESDQFARYGVNITCEGFVSMSTVTKFNSFVLPLPQLSQYRSPELSEFKSRAKKMIQAKAWIDLTAAIEKEVKALDNTPEFNCMTRHLLESAGKISSQAPDQLKRLSIKKAPDASRLIQKLVSNHLVLLGAGKLLDHWAAPIQARGTPIICQDVPKIEVKWGKK